MTVVRGRVVDHGGGEVHVWVDRSTMEYPTGDVLVVEVDNWPAIRGRVLAASGHGLIHIATDVGEGSCPEGDVLVFPVGGYRVDEPETQTAPEPLLARVLRLLREAADALDELPTEIRDVRPPTLALFDTSKINGARLRLTADQIERRASNLLATVQSAWETLRPYAEALAEQERPS